MMALSWSLLIVGGFSGVAATYQDTNRHLANMIGFYGIGVGIVAFAACCFFIKRAPWQ